LARFTSMLQGQRDLTTVGRMLLSELAPLVNAQQGVIYQVGTEESEGMVLLSAFADDGEDGHRQRLQVGEGLVGQCAAEKRRMLITDLPKDTVPIRSGLFEAVPRNVIVLPVLFEDRAKAVIELASLNVFTASHSRFWSNSPPASASCSIVSRPRCRPKDCSSNLSSLRPNFKHSRKNCSRPTSSWRKKPSSLPSRTSK